MVPCPNCVETPKEVYSTDLVREGKAQHAKGHVDTFWLHFLVIPAQI